MPWKIKKGKGKRPFKVVKESTGKTVGTSVSRDKALAYLRALYAHEKK